MSARIPQRADRIDPMLALLRRARWPLTAAEICDAIGWIGSHETLRRRVRETAQDIRDQGVGLCASTRLGYYLAAREAEFAHYLDRRRGEARKLLAIVAEQQRHRDRADPRQGVLFGTA